VLAGLWISSGDRPPPAPLPTCDLPSRVRIFILDSSDPPISPSQTAATVDLLKRFLDEGHLGDRVFIGKLVSDPSAPLLLEEFCDPGEREHSTAKVTPQEAKRRRQRVLVDRVLATAEKFRAPSPTPSSPIAELLGQLFRNQRVLASAPGVVKEVYFVSDILFHVPGVASAYRRELQTPRARAYVDSFAAKVTNTKVTVGLLYRPEHKAIQERDAKPWLIAFLRKSGVETIEWVELW
jgi:hypothetical protein